MEGIMIKRSELKIGDEYEHNENGAANNPWRVVGEEGNKWLLEPIEEKGNTRRQRSPSSRLDGHFTCEKNSSMVTLLKEEVPIELEFPYPWYRVEECFLRDSSRTITAAVHDGWELVSTSAGANGKIIVVLVKFCD